MELHQRLRVAVFRRIHNSIYIILGFCRNQFRLASKKAAAATTPSWQIEKLSAYVCIAKFCAPCNNISIHCFAANYKSQPCQVPSPLSQPSPRRLFHIVIIVVVAVLAGKKTK